MRIIGIDPGSSGGIAVLDDKSPVKCYKMPRGVKDLKTFFTQLKTDNSIVFLEKVNLRHDDISVGGKAFAIQKMLKSYSELRTVLTILEYPVLMIHPATWQAHLNLRLKRGIKEEKKDRKNRYKLAAQSYFTEVKATLWNCDALLILESGRRKLRLDEDWIKRAVYENEVLPEYEAFLTACSPF